MTRTLTTLVLALAASLALAQDKPLDVPKDKLPSAKVECVVCKARGAGHGPERAVAGVEYRGRAYFFCNAKEVSEFKADPEAFIPLPLPRPMPKFDLTDLSGQAWGAEAFKGKVVLIDFWATWCGPCRQMKPVVEKVRAKFADRGFRVLSVSTDEKRADLDKYLAKNTFPDPVLHDTEGRFADWRVSSIPAFFLVKDGQIVAEWRGVVKQGEIEKAVEVSMR